ncbi:hypothetical protein Desti_1569 [Desulfomonile tiedjei DSM 6799]|uniref:Uncharacterized protein n=1 Tax=Desulfomonile tiedjei (strain ATCC 49306 / DSM 6799 / DCB-1) TaxID=706587 RepID=I4C3Y9_DESTA|nr:hypothetical protein Desti_1569 [Desulfomonile tiedjei DSM 6799]
MMTEKKSGGTSCKKFLPDFFSRTFNTRRNLNFSLEIQVPANDNIFLSELCVGVNLIAAWFATNTESCFLNARME